MSGNSLASLLTWMKGSSRLLGWGLMVALEQRKANLIVLQEYIKRFDDNSYLPPISGEVVITENRRMELVHDFVMDVPVLSFENNDPNDSKAMLTMAVVGGSQLTLEKEVAGWKAYKVDEFNPLQGPKLHLDLLLNQVPGVIDTDGRIKLDLRNSNNFRLSFAESNQDQEKGGNFFRDLFNQLPDEQRVYPLGKIERGTNELMRPQSFELRTQYDGGGAVDFRSGCILVLIRMEKRQGGNFPGESFKYLIPDDQGKDYSATVLFEQSRISASVLIEAMTAAIQGSSFNYEYDAEGHLLRAVSQQGVVVIPPGEVKGPIEMEDGRVLDLHVSHEEWRLSLMPQSLMEIEFSETGASVFGKFEGETKLVLHTSATGRIFARMRAVIEFRVDYEQRDDGAGGFSLRQTKYTYDMKLEYLEFGGGEGVTDPWTEFFKQVVFGFLMAVLEPIFKAVLNLAFKNVITVGGSINAYIQEVIKLNFGQAIQGNEIYAPHDIGFFGRINPQQTSFLINPMQPVIKAGSPQPFATTPVVAGVQWKVENLVEGPGSPGTINSSGVYTAPAASTIKGRFTRVRVTATAPGTGYYSSALVTVVIDELSVHPLIQICGENDTVELSAGVLGEEPLQWSIKNAVPGESGEIKPSVKPRGDHTYHHGPVVTGKTYVLDQIEVKNSRTGGTRSVYVLALQNTPMVTVKIVSIDGAQGLVQLAASVNGNPVPDGRGEWSLAIAGQGTIDKATGLFRADPTANGRFALVFFSMEIEFVGTAKGHVILPLPLVAFPQWLEVLTQ